MNDKRCGTLLGSREVKATRKRKRHTTSPTWRGRENANSWRFSNLSAVTYLRQGVLHHIARVPHDSRWKLAPTTITQRPRYVLLLFSFSTLLFLRVSIYLSIYVSIFFTSPPSTSYLLPPFLHVQCVEIFLSSSLVRLLALLSLHSYWEIDKGRGGERRRDRERFTIPATREQGTMTSARGRFQQHRGIP